MASHNVFASPLTSSPLRKSQFFLSSSPDLPSVHDLVSQGLRPPPFKSSIQVAAKASKSTATTEFRSDLGVAKPEAGEGVQKEEDASPQIEDSSVIEIEVDAVPKVFQARQKKKENLGATSGVRCDASSRKDQQPWKKFQFKDDHHDQELTEGSKETDGKPLPAHESTGIISPMKTAAARPPKLPHQLATEKKDDTKEPLYIEQAMTRRLDWTPPTQKNAIRIDSESPFSGASCPSQPPSSKARSFEQLVDSYKCTGILQHDISRNADENSGFLKKRKLIEMVVDTTPKVTPSIPAQAPEKPSEKQKAPKKKPRTITELATAAYKAQSLDESIATTGPRDGLNHTSEKENEAGGKDQKGKKAAARPRKRSSRKKKVPSPPKPVLLPPTDALQEVAKQDFVFGTSSQLAVEQSPTFLRYLQVAMNESNELDIIDLEASPIANSMEVSGQRPKLWHAGARDEYGELFNLEVSEIAYDPSREMHASLEESDPFGHSRDGGKPSLVEPRIDGVKVVEIDDPFNTSVEELPSFGLQPASIINRKEQRVDDTPMGRGPKELPCMSVEASKQMNDAATDEIVADQPQRPTYDLYTDAQLAKEVMSYGFKAVKSRKAKIALLEQCWQSKVRSNSVGIGNSASFATKAGPSSRNPEPSTPELKRRRGRPRKNSIGASTPQEPPPSAQPRESPVRARAKLKGTAASAPVSSPKSKRGRPPKKTAEKPLASQTQMTTRILIEIPDSESDAESAGSRTSRESTSSPPPPVDFSLSLDDGPDSLVSEDSGGSHLSGIYSYITKAVTSAPRSTDPMNPSWHEKILLYDSIILEDLVDWLNDGQLKRVGSDDEVRVGEVKKWCELKSICCLMRVNLRGKERKRY